MHTVNIFTDVPMTLDIHRTVKAKICNHSQVADSLDMHGYSASKLWNVANYHARNEWDTTGEIPDENELTSELKTHTKYSWTAFAVQSAGS